MNQIGLNCAGWAEQIFYGMLRPGSIVVSSVSNMYDYFSVAAGSDLVSYLEIAGHGGLDGLDFGQGTDIDITVGSDTVSNYSFDQFGQTFQNMSTFLSGEAYIFFKVCRLGRNVPLMTKLAQAFGVPCYAGDGDENVLYNYNTGQINCAYPSGQFYVGVTRPPTPRFFF